MLELSCGTRGNSSVSQIHRLLLEAKIDGQVYAIPPLLLLNPFSQTHKEVFSGLS